MEREIDRAKPDATGQVGTHTVENINKLVSLSTSIREAITQLQAEEAGLLLQRSTEARIGFEWSLLLAVSGALANLLILGTVFSWSRPKRLAANAPRHLSGRANTDFGGRLMLRPWEWR